VGKTGCGLGLVARFNNSGAESSGCTAREFVSQCIGYVMRPDLTIVQLPELEQERMFGLHSNQI
jgi:hypothetical protein